MMHHLSQLDSDNAGYAEKLLQPSTVGQYCKRLVGIMQVQSAPSQHGSLFTRLQEVLLSLSLPQGRNDLQNSGEKKRSSDVPTFSSITNE